MIKIFFFIAITFFCRQVCAQNENASSASADSVYWIQVITDSGVVHAAIATPKGIGPFPAIVILHGTHGFAQEYIQLARKFSENGFVGIAVCWFAGGKGKGARFITPIEFKDAPPLIDVAGLDRFRISRYTIDSLVRRLTTLPKVQRDRLAFFGHSRGAGASLDYVLTHPDMAQAVILNSAGYPPEFIKRASEVKIPVLILHGITDSPDDGGSAFTDIAMARQFETALRTTNKNVEAKYYEEGGHNGMFSNSTQFDDTVQRIANFLRNKLPK